MSQENNQKPSQPPLEFGVIMCRLPSGKYRAVEVRVRGDKVLERRPGAVVRDGARTTTALALELLEAVAAEAQVEDWK